MQNNVRHGRDSASANPMKRLASPKICNDRLQGLCNPGLLIRGDAPFVGCVNKEGRPFRAGSSVGQVSGLVLHVDKNQIAAVALATGGSLGF